MKKVSPIPQKIEMLGEVLYMPHTLPPISKANRRWVLTNESEEIQ
tara:strand:- start:32 stop:166 length:135 start_codon:yes stop_codon:yes gene_type:complete